MDSDTTKTFLRQNEDSEQERRVPEGGVNEIRPIWTSLMEEMLIHYIRANRVLWDHKHPHFTKPMLKRRKVEDIAAIIARESGYSDEQALAPEDVWRKFRNLRTFFVREVRKVNESKRNPNEEPYESKWIHFNRMLFLVDALKKSINAEVPLPGVGVHPASVKLEGSRARVPIGSLSDLSRIQQQHQDFEDELRIGGEWDARNISTIGSVTESVPEPAVAGPSYSTAVDRNCDNVISRSRASKRMKLAQSQEKQQKLSEVSEAFGKFVIASIRKLPEEKQHSLMAHITQAIAEFNDK